MLRAARGGNSERFWELFKIYYGFLKEHSDDSQTLPSNFYDLLPFNIMISADQKLKGFDFEWAIEGRVPLEKVLFRAASVLYQRESRWLKCLPEKPATAREFIRLVFKKLHLRISSADLSKRLLEEGQFQFITVGKKRHEPKRNVLKEMAVFLVDNVNHPSKIMRSASHIILQSSLLFFPKQKTDVVSMPQRSPKHPPSVSFDSRSKSFGPKIQLLRRLLLVDHIFLLETFVIRNLKVKYRRSVFGFMWTLLHPLLLGSIYYFLFKHIAKFQILNYGAFVVVSIIPWTFISQSIVESSEVMVNNAHLLRRIYFPRETFPLSSVITNFITLILSLPVMVLFAYLGGGGVGLATFSLIPVLLLTFLITHAAGLILSVLYVFYRDVKHIIGIVMQVLFYATPVIYEPQMVPERARFLLNFNPLANLFPAYREILLHQSQPDWLQLGQTFILTTIILALGYKLFARWNKMIPEYV